MIVLNGLKTCDTCRKALKALRDAGHQTGLRDLHETPPDAAEIARWRAGLGDAVLNTRSRTWRDLPGAERDGDPVDLMVAHPALVKRPVIESGEALHLGWTPATRAALGL